AMEREQCRRRGHISEVAQYLARQGEIGIGKTEHLLRRVQDLGAAGMEQKARELAETHAVSIEEGLHGVGEVIADKPWKVGAQHHAEAILLDVPAHDPLGV